MTRHVAFSDLRTAAYCPRKCYYQRTREDHDREPPPEVDAIRDLATRYDDLLDASPEELAVEPIAVPPATYRERLATARDRLGGGDGEDGVDGKGGGDGVDGEDDTDHWARLCDPADRNVLVTGRDCRGIVQKVLGAPLEPAIVSAGKPPERGVWHPQSVHAVAAAKALSWEHETPVEGAWLEYPAAGVIRRLDLTTRRKAEYRAALRTVRELDGPPPRIDNRSKCAACEFAEECGVRTRTLRSLLGFG